MSAQHTESNQTDAKEQFEDQVSPVLDTLIHQGQ